MINLGRFEDPRSMEDASARFLVALANQRMDPKGVAENTPAIPVYKVAPPKPREDAPEWTDKDTEMLKKLRLAGVSQGQIAYQMNRPRGQIVARIRDLGLIGKGGSLFKQAGEKWGDGGAVK